MVMLRLLWKMMRRVLPWLVAVALVGCLQLAFPVRTETSAPTRVLVDTDMDTDDILALFYLLKQNRSEIDLKAVTISANSWSDAGHAVNHLYDILHLMDRNDIEVGVGGDGGISADGTIFPDVGGYHPLIEQGMSTAGNCRYRQAISPGARGRLDVDTNYGNRRLLPQGNRKYLPLQQATTQQVMIDLISTGPTTVFLMGSHTNLATLLMTHPELKKNIEHIFVMGGAIRSQNPFGCCPINSTSCKPQQYGYPGNLGGYTSNPYAEFNIFCDPFAAYQVFHSGIPITLVPLDATNTIPITRKFMMEFENNQNTLEARYCFKTLQKVHDSWRNDQFYSSFSIWDAFMTSVAVSIIQNGYKRDGYNKFADMQYMNITIVTSNEPYGTHDGSNPIFYGHDAPLFNLKRDGVHSGHVQVGFQDPFCLVNNGSEKGRCQDGYTKEVIGSEAVEVLVAQCAKRSDDANMMFPEYFFKEFMEVINHPRYSSKLYFSKEFSFYNETFYHPNLANRKSGKSIIFDMDMTTGDILALIYLLKVPIEIVDLKGIFVNGNGWTNPATIDIIYDLLHMMGRDDIPVGLGSMSSLGISSTDCRYVKYIPHGSGGYIDTDTLFGLARNLPRSPRRYSSDNSVAYGARRSTSNPKLRQPLAMEVWKSIVDSMYYHGGREVTLLTSGPLTNLANIITSDPSARKAIQDIYIVGGHIPNENADEGNVFTAGSNIYSEFNFFLDPLAAKTVIESQLPITLVPLSVQRSVASFTVALESFLDSIETPESAFAHILLSTLHDLQQKSSVYHHMGIFLGEILGSAVLVNDSALHVNVKTLNITVLADGNDVDTYGQSVIDNAEGSTINVIDSLNVNAYYRHFTSVLNAESQSAVVSINDQELYWINNRTGTA